MIRIVVDFPAPLGPRNPVTRPAWAVKLTSSTAVKLPYFLVTPSTVIIGRACWHRGRGDEGLGCCCSSSMTSWPSTWMFGSRRSSHPGSHQLRSPSSSIVAGTSTIRTTVASMKIAAASPMPNILPKTSLPSTKERKTVIITAAPAVMTLADLARPSATASALSPVLSYSSLIRDSRNTS